MYTCNKCFVGVFNTDRYVHKCKVESFDEYYFAKRLVERTSSPFSLLKNKIVIPNLRPSKYFEIEYEADLVAIDNDFFLKECEIKNSWFDFLHDIKKEKWKKQSNMRKFYYAIDSDFIDKALKADRPHGTGLIVMHRDNKTDSVYPEVIKNGSVNKNAKPISEQTFNNLCLIGCRRLWKTEHVIESFKK